MRNDDPTKGEKPDTLLQDYLDGLLGVGNLDSSFSTQQIDAQNFQQQESQTAISQSISASRYQTVDRVVGDHMSSENIEPIRATPAPNNVLPLPRFAETKPLTLKLPLPKLKPVAPLPKVVEAPVEISVDVEPVDVEIAQEIPLEIEPQAETVTEISEEVFDETVEEANYEIAQEIEEETAIDIEEEQGFQPREWLDNGRPDWAQGRFECLMFSVGGLTLAVPLIELGNISPLTDELTPLFGQIDWFMGLLPTRTGAKLRTVDTAKIVMPERYHDGLRNNYRFVISIAGMDWGLAVDDVSTAISLAPEDVKWRSQRSKRPWLAGTLVSQMCAVLDIQQLAFLMFQAEQRR